MKRFIIIFVLLFGFMYVASQFWILAINSTDSLDHRFFLIKKGAFPDSRGQYVVFQPQDKNRYNSPFIKIVGGLGNDIVTRENRSFYVNGKYIGDAKKFSKLGKATKLGPIGLIPQGSYFVYTNNKYSYDSRYKEIGWVKSSDIIGVAYPIY